MPTDIVIPSVGESVTSGVIAKWTKPAGAFVKRDETVIELETDKITMEIPSPASGVLAHGAKEGDEVGVGAVVGSIDESAEAPAPDAPAPAHPAEPKKGSETASKPEPRPEPKADPKPQPASQAAASVVTVASPAASNGEALATPLARKVAQDLGVDLSRVTGTGAGHRIREQDVIAAAQAAKGGSGPVASSARRAEARGVSRERMSPLRQRVATRLVQAQQTAAMLTTFNEVDMGAVMELRKRTKDQFSEKHGVNLGFMSFFVKAATSALRAFPLVNASIVEEGGSPAIERHDYQDIAIAVSSPKGLVVPVLRNCQSLSFAGVESGIKDFAVRAKEGKLALEEMQGGTFTITNGGVFGSLMSTPILNPPQSAILGMHAIKNRPAEDPSKPGTIALRPMMYLALSYDHRIVDGAEAVSFLVHIKQCIEDPTRLLLDL